MICPPGEGLPSGIRINTSGKIRQLNLRGPEAAHPAVFGDYGLKLGSDTSGTPTRIGNLLPKPPFCERCGRRNCRPQSILGRYRLPTLPHSRLEKLESIIFQKQLGTVREKTSRIADLAAEIAKQIDGSSDDAHRAGLLCKADLVSDMVFEFDKMQGIAGRYYALNDGEPESVATAIEEHYLPKFAGDKLPSTKTAVAVALADRLDTLTGIFGTYICLFLMPILYRLHLSLIAINRIRND